MSLQFVSEVWDLLKTHIDIHDHTDAADSLVNLLVENNYEANEIKEAFSGDKKILTALKNYIAEHDGEEEFTEEENDDDYDEWD
jgi:hypothetical protein